MQKVLCLSRKEIKNIYKRYIFHYDSAKYELKVIKFMKENHEDLNSSKGLFHVNKYFRHINNQNRYTGLLELIQKGEI